MFILVMVEAVISGFVNLLYKFIFDFSLIQI